ncbi:hypothetical protein [Pseudosulfitobacter sp. SM2401]|uniref:hypothetical protein n=1 Tax=Pseudosulfitobacter sp. SM2401 TaxID=3350098 RepID=UPI0036F24D1D
MSFWQIEDVLHERGIDIFDEMVRFWVTRFGAKFAKEIGQVAFILSCVSRSQRCKSAATLQGLSVVTDRFTTTSTMKNIWKPGKPTNENAVPL